MKPTLLTCAILLSVYLLAGCVPGNIASPSHSSWRDDSVAVTTSTTTESETTQLAAGEQSANKVYCKGLIVFNCGNLTQIVAQTASAAQEPVAEPSPATVTPTKQPPGGWFGTILAGIGALMWFFAIVGGIWRFVLHSSTNEYDA